MELVKRFHPALHPFTILSTDDESASAERTTEAGRHAEHEFALLISAKGEITAEEDDRGSHDTAFDNLECVNEFGRYCATFNCIQRFRSSPRVNSAQTAEC